MVVVDFDRQWTRRVFIAFTAGIVQLQSIFLIVSFCLSLAYNSHWAFCLQPIKTGLFSVLHLSGKLCSIYQLVVSPRPQWVVSVVLTLFCLPLIKWLFYLPYHQRFFPCESLISVFCFYYGSRKIKCLPFHLLILPLLLGNTNYHC